MEAAWIYFDEAGRMIKQSKQSTDHYPSSKRSNNQPTTKALKYQVKLSTNVRVQVVVCLCSPRAAQFLRIETGMSFT